MKIHVPEYLWTNWYGASSCWYQVPSEPLGTGTIPGMHAVFVIFQKQIMSPFRQALTEKVMISSFFTDKLPEFY